MKISKIRAVFISLAIILLVSGYFYVSYLWQNGVVETTNNTLNTALIAESVFSKGDISKLDINESDLNKVEYKKIKKSLQDLVKIDANVRFVYVYKKIGDRLYFLVDSEPFDSKDYSPPGQEYTEADPQYYKPFEYGVPFVTSPAKDRWGTWVSASVPIKDYDSGEVNAVFAMDYPAENWSASLISKIKMSLVVILILVLLLVIFYVVIKNRISLTENEERFRFFSSFINDGAVISNKKGEIVLWNKKAEKIFGYSEVEMKGKILRNFIVDNSNKTKEDVLVFAKSLDDNDGEGKIMVSNMKTKNGENIVIEVSASRIMMNGEKHTLGVIKDVTKRVESEDELKRLAEDTKQALQDSERLNRLMVNREIKMLELKKELHDLKNKANNLA